MAVININRNQFEEMVHSGKTVLVEFSAPWCVYCRRLAPALESVAEEYKDTLIFTAVNIDDEPELAETEAIEVVPTLLIYHSGQTLGSIVAPESRAQLVAFIEETLQHRTQEVNNAQHIYDMIVVGGGPGGYTAALYAARAGMDTVVLEKLSAGGQMALTEQIDNYPGFEDGIDGFSLGEKMKRGTERFGVETKLTEVLSLELSGSVKKAVTSEGAMYAKSIVLATGAGPRELGVDREQALIGKGVHYCAACDGMFYRNKTVVIAGGGNTAAADALILSRICKKVIVVHRRGTLLYIVIIRKPNQLVCGFISKANFVIILYPFEDAVGITPRLHLNIGDRFAFFLTLGFGNTHRLAVNEKGIVHLTCACGEFTDSNAQCGRKIQLFHILNDPAGLTQFFINHKPCFFFGCHITCPPHLCTP